MYRFDGLYLGSLLEVSDHQRCWPHKRNDKVTRALSRKKYSVNASVASREKMTRRARLLAQ